MDELDGVGDCRQTAPAESFNPQVQWTWNGGESAVTPLVANLTDDDGNGTIDLCDTPDVVVVTGGLFGVIHVLDVQVIRDAEDRWIQARRIWNQHTYHVTNVREDSVIPAVEPPSWRELNTFRTNAQIEGGAVCLPPAG